MVDSSTVPKVLTEDFKLLETNLRDVFLHYIYNNNSPF
jgi:hypothetical protein